MANADRSSARAVTLFRSLQNDLHRFGFLQTMRRLECAHPDQPRHGESLRPSDDPVRFGQEPSLAFATSSLASFEPPIDDDPARLAVLLFGVFGPNGPLPLHLTEFARGREKHDHDRTLRAFVDIFHHRLIGLFYRAWANAQPVVHFDRPESNRFALYIGSLFGIGASEARHRDAVPDREKLHQAGLLACATRSAEGLRALLAQFFDLPVRIRQFVGQWVEVPAGSRSILGQAPANCCLGSTAIAGEAMWDCQTKFQIVLGPMAIADYEHLLPCGDSFDRLAALVRNWIGHELEWDVCLVLREDEVPPTQLGVRGQLGWTTWTAGSPGRDPDDVILHPDLTKRAERAASAGRGQLESNPLT